MFRRTFASFLLAASLAAAQPADPVGALQWVKQIGSSGISQVTGTAVDLAGNFYVTGNTSSPDFPASKTIGTASGTNVFVIEFDPAGQILYAVRIGGRGTDTPAGIAVSSDGSVYIGGTTTSTDFPVTKGAYQASFPASVLAPGGYQPGASFLLRMTSDGSLAWATDFGDAMSSATAVAVGPDGDPYLAGYSYGDLPTTPGAYRVQFQSTESCGGITPCIVTAVSGFLTKFRSDGSAPAYSTYTLSPDDSSLGPIAALAIDALGNAYFSTNFFSINSASGVALMNATGSALLYSAPVPGNSITAMTLDGEGNVYVTGAADSTFQPTPGAFQTTPPTNQPSGYFSNGDSGFWSGAYVVKLDGALSRVLAAAVLGGDSLTGSQSIAMDPAGDVIVGGYTQSKNLPTRLPFQGSFVDTANFEGQDDFTPTTGFTAVFDGSLSHLRFFTYAGDVRAFGVVGVEAAPNGDVFLAGETSVLYQGENSPEFFLGGAIIANRIAFAPAPSVTLDSVVNFASKYAIPLSPGEAVEARGAGFGADAQILVNGASIATASRSASSVVGLLPMDLATSGALKIEVVSGGVASNPVLMPAAVSSPGIYSIHGSGAGQGYIRNADGSFNSPNRPAKPGDAITIFATGVGNLQLEGSYVVTPQPISIFVDGYYADGVTSAFASAGGLPGKTYQITVKIPTAAEIAKEFPGLTGFLYLPEVAVTMVLGPVHTRNAIYPANSAAVSQPGIALYIGN